MMSRSLFVVSLPVVFVLTWLVPWRSAADSAIVHVVRPGDTLASIAERYYGDPRRETVIVAENSLSNEGGFAIVTGLRLTIPTVSYHRVQEGETWSELAKRFYGDAQRTFVLFKANSAAPGRQPDPGAELLIPYPLRHVVGQNETLNHVARIYYGQNDNEAEGVKILRRFNAIKRIRLQRGQIVLVPLAGLVLSEKGRAIVKQQNEDRNLGGDVRDKQARIEAALPHLRAHISSGLYADAVAMGSYLLGSGDLTGNQIVTIQRILAVAYVALDRFDLAIEAFKSVLEKQPDLELDSIRTSPKVMYALAQAKNEIKREQKAKTPRKRRRR
ncbi:MAG: LysM peptidoglycan-binding domain-containing protein [Deltaproteobacteria bacterium]|nr:LysM peptidoglycan-binding domain-containing protein [Deltaproteobacteria bacterium]